MGQICIGIPQHEPQKEAMLEAVTELFERTGLPYTREPDILRRLWCKWMLNVGVNQAVMVEEGTYGTVQRPGPARQMMKAAMAEVVELAGREGIRVTMEDLDAYVDLIDSLNPDGMPSMRQDGLARRPSEVEFFAGTVIRRAEAAGLDVPVNRELYRGLRGWRADTSDLRCSIRGNVWLEQEKAGKRNSFSLGHFTPRVQNTPSPPQRSPQPMPHGFFASSWSGQCHNSGQGCGIQEKTALSFCQLLIEGRKGH